MSDTPLWKPSQEQIANTRLTSFQKNAAKVSGKSFASYENLYHWSVTEIERFWELIFHESKLIHSQPYANVLDSRIMPGGKWFSGCRLNFAENLLRFRDSQTAIVSYSECRAPLRLSYEQLYDQVAACATGLKRFGVRPGDRVAGYVPNIPESIVAMLAATSIGAIWSSSSPDFGLQGLLDRFGQIEPKILITAEGYRYHGKEHTCLPNALELCKAIPSIQKCIVIPYLHLNYAAGDLKTTSWSDLLSHTGTSLEFEQLPFDHPVYILYSSGTTGKPKCIVHGAGGTLLQHWKEHALHTDLRRSDVITYYTTCGWMMWNWLVSALQIGSTIVLYEGSPSFPNQEFLWDLIDREKITVFGTSPKYLSHCQHTGLAPMKSHSLETLRAILSTGSPLSADNFSFVYEQIKSDLCLSSISGGTDIVSCFMLGNPNLPVYSEQIQCRGLGMKVEAWDDSGKPVVDQVGELVCSAPFPSMPVSFWNDPTGEQYRNAYFSHYPGVWRHGDYIKITENGGVIVYGRSDATLNPGGVRIGTAEIYNPVESIPDIADSLVIGQKWHNDIRIVLFVVLKSGKTLDASLIQLIKETIRKRTTPRHVPSIIAQIDEVPRTINGKKVELAVSRVIHGEEVTNREALANPAALDQFVDLPILR